MSAKVTTKMTFDIFRCLEGPRAGCVDYLGVIGCASLTEAEEYAVATFDLSPNEHFDIQIATPDDE